MTRRRLPIGTILFFLFAGFTLLELFLIFQLARWVGWGATVLIAIATAVVGSAMAKRQGLAVLAQAQADLAHGRFPAQPLADGVMILLGAALLVTPGMITDLLGFSTLIPPLRRFYARLLLGWARRRFAGRAGAAQSAAPPADAVDVDFHRVE